MWSTPEAKTEHWSADAASASTSAWCEPNDCTSVPCRPSTNVTWPDESPVTTAMSLSSSTAHTSGGLRSPCASRVVWLVTVRLATCHTHTTPPAVPHARCEPCGLKATESTRALSDVSRPASVSVSPVVSRSETAPSSHPTAIRPEPWCTDMAHAAPPYESHEPLALSVHRSHSVIMPCSPDEKMRPCG